MFVDFRKSLIVDGKTPQEALEKLYVMGEELLEIIKSQYGAPPPSDFFKKLEDDWKKESKCKCKIKKDKEDNFPLVFDIVQVATLGTDSDWMEFKTKIINMIEQNLDYEKNV